jgi:hypothetical protein
MTEKPTATETPHPKPRKTSKVRKASSHLAAITQELHKVQKRVARMQTQLALEEQRANILLKGQKEAKEQLDRALSHPEE